MHEMEKKLLAYCQRIATCSVFRRADEYVRYDFISHGFGWRREFNPTIGAKTAWLWVNSYRSAWVSFDLMNSVGWGRADKSKRFQVYHSGSMVKPYANWYWRAWKLIFHGHTPEWIQRRKLRKLREERAAYYAEEE